MNKVKNELLVTGYVRQQEKKLELSKIIPESIYQIIFQLQLLVVIWHPEHSNPRIKLSDDCSVASITDNIDLLSKVTVYGDYIVKYGDSLEWKLTLQQQTKTGTNFVIGLMPNTGGLQTNYAWDQDVHGCGLATNSGFFGNSAKSHKYSSENVFGKQGDILEMKFNWIESILSYRINGKDLGNALEKSEINLMKDKDAKYRLIVSILWAADVELLIEGCYS